MKKKTQEKGVYSASEKNQSLTPETPKVNNSKTALKMVK